MTDSGTVVGPSRVVLRSEETSPDNVFRRKGSKAWAVRFAGGEEFILLPSKGAAYLHLLLAKKGTAVPVTKLALLVAKNPTEFLLGDAGPSSDMDAMAAYRARAEELCADLETATRDGIQSEIDRIQEEMRWLEAHIKRDRGRGGKLRKEADDRNRVRLAVRAAIRRAINEIAIDDKRLAEHLRRPNLVCGWHPCYHPRDSIEWDT